MNSPVTFKILLFRKGAVYKERKRPEHMILLMIPGMTQMPIQA